MIVELGHFALILALSVAVIQSVLSVVDFKGRDMALIGKPDGKIVGGPDIWSDAEGD